MKSILKRLLFFVPVALGAFLLANMMASSKKPETKAVAEAVRRLRVLTIKPTLVVPMVRGYGTAEPARSWQAVAEVSGRLVHRNPELRSGNTLDAGTVLFRIDATSYRLVVARLKAEIAQIDAQLAEMERRAANDKATLSLEKKSLDVAKASLARDRDLAKRNAVAQQQVEQQEREVLAQEVRLQALRNSIALIPAERERLAAQRAVAVANEKEAQLDVTRTTIAAPFRCDIGDVSAEEGQYVAAGQTLVETFDIARTEVEAKMQMRELGRLIPDELRDVVSFDESVVQTAVRLGITAQLQMVGAPRRVAWDARLARVRERVDEKTRTLGFIAVVDDPYAKAKPGVRPPLTKGIFCELLVRGRPQPNQILVPRSAVQNGRRVHVVVAGRLETREVVVQYEQDDFAVIASGLASGDVVIIADPTPAIEKMKVEPQEDAEVAQRIAAQAAGDNA